MVDLFNNASTYLFQWQTRLINDIVQGRNKFGTFEKSRRVGGTWAMAIAAVLYCTRTGHNCWFSSSDEKNAREFIQYVHKVCDLLNAILGQTWVDLARDATSETVKLPNGSTINALSSNPKALRGKDGLIILDEMALHEDQEELFRAAQGCVIQRGRCWMLSTHHGPTTLFYTLSQEAANGKDNWSHHKVTLVDAVREGYARRFAPDQTDEQFINGIRLSSLSDEVFGQEFMCLPVSLSALITAEQYDSLALWDVPDTLDPKQQYNPLLIGIDVGRVHDLTVVWCIERYTNPKAVEQWDQYDYKTVCVKVIRNADIPTQYQQIKPIVSHPNVERVLIDQGSVGRSLADALCSERPDICEPFGFTNPRKAVLAERVKGFVEHGKVSLPPDPAIRADVLCVQRQATKGGTLTYDGHTRDSHGDAFWALALALEAACADGGVVLVGLPKPEQRPDERQSLIGEPTLHASHE